MGSTSPAIGIDLGTTYSCVAIFKNGQIEIIANANGKRKTPSYVAFTEAERLIGKAAMDNLGSNPTNTVFDIKRIIGRKTNDKALQEIASNWPFETVNKDGKPYVLVNFRHDQNVLSPEEISSMILKYMKEMAEAYHGSEIKKAVVTVPAYFNDAQRQATKDAARIAGLDILRVVNDPTAAGIAYGFIKKDLKNETVLILDLGGGTFDVSILTIHNGIYTVKATAGDTDLGGENIDTNVVNYFLEEIKRKQKKDLSNNTKAIYRLRTACEKAKRNLTSNDQASIVVDNLFDETDFKSTITKARFEKINEKLFEKLKSPIMKVLRDAEVEKDRIDSIVLVGGDSRINYLQRLIGEIFPGKEIDKSINPDEAVGYGAAILAAHLNGDEHESLKHFQLRDVTPLSLGIEVIGGQMEVIIGRNTQIPASDTKIFTTNFDNQSAVHIVVFEGERPLVKDNNKLGEFVIEGIAPAQREIPKIFVTFDIDRDGILSVSAVDKRCLKTGAKMTILNDKGRLSEPEIWKMIKEAKKFKEYDKERQAKVKEKLELEEYCMDAKSAVSNFKYKISATEMMFIRYKCDECLQWLLITQEDHDVDVIKEKMLQLKLQCSKILEKCWI